MIRGLPAHVGMSLTCSVGPIAVDMTEKPKVASQFIRLSSIKEWMGESIKEIPISKQAINPFRIEGIINVEARSLYSINIHGFGAVKGNLYHLGRYVT